MVFTQGRVWLGGVVLAGALLASTVPGLPVSAHAAVSLPGSKPVATSLIEPVSTGARIVRQQLRLVSVPTTVTQVAVVMATKPTGAKQAQPPVSDASVQAAKAPVPVPIQVANAPEPQPVQEVSRGIEGDTLVNHALSLQGIPYVFGGTTRTGFDCSGFTRYVFAGSGIRLPRTSYEQFATGQPVNRSQLQPGDLVFFSTYSTGASHVGIYIGGGRFVHASDQGVRVTSLNDSYYAARYIGARRVAK